MVAELRRDDMAGEAMPVRDAVAFRLVEHVLQSVRMEPLLVNPYDQEQYGKMLDTLDTSKRKSADDEALYVTYLKALSEAVSKIDIMYHHSLLNNIFSVRIWYLQRDTMVALLDLITRLAAVADQYLRECLQMLVNNFTPPIIVKHNNEVPPWAVSRKKEIFSRLCESLKTISDTVPLAPRMLRDIIDRSMPKLFDNKAKMISFVECMLGLDTDRMGDLIGAILLAKVVDLITELDVNITWEDILQEEHNKGIFEMELEDLDGDEDGDGFGQAGTKVLFGGNACAEKLDGLMVVVCEHLKSLDRQCLYKEFVILKTIFRASLLRVHRSKFAQFIMFYACSLDPLILGEEFALFLTDIVKNKEEDPISRMSAVSLRLKQSFLTTNHFTVAFRSWKADMDCCRWEGVRCRGSTGRVSSLDLGDRGLESPNLDLSLFELSSLRYLNLSGNDFHMSEMPSIGFERLTKLTHLNLSATNFSGQVPSGIGRLSNLVSLDLSFRFEPSIGPFHVDGKFHADITRPGQLTLPNLTVILENMASLRELHLGFVDLSNQGGEWCTALARVLCRILLFECSSTRL